MFMIQGPRFRDEGLGLKTSLVKTCLQSVLSSPHLLIIAIEA